MWSGLNSLLECLADQHRILDIPTMAWFCKDLAVQRLRVLQEALVGRRADPCGAWCQHWQDAASCFALLDSLSLQTPGTGAATAADAAAEAAAVLLRLLPALRGQGSSRVEQCVLRCLEVLALPWRVAAERAHLTPLTPTHLLSCLEALALGASGTLALLEAHLARHSRPARLEQTGLALTGAVACALMLMKSGAAWNSTVGEQRERLVAAAMAAGEAVVRLTGCLVQQEEVQLEGVSAVSLGHLMSAVHVALHIASKMMPGTGQAPLPAAANMAVSASKLVLAVLHVSPARQALFFNTCAPACETSLFGLLDLAFWLASRVDAPSPVLLGREAESWRR